MEKKRNHDHQAKARGNQSSAQTRKEAVREEVAGAGASGVEGEGGGMTTREQYRRAYSMVRTMRGGYPANVNPNTYAGIRADVMGYAFKHMMDSYVQDKLVRPFHWRNNNVSREGDKYVYCVFGDGIPF